jgi:hypothetical protein
MIWRKASAFSGDESRENGVGADSRGLGQRGVFALSDAVSNIARHTGVVGLSDGRARGAVIRDDGKIHRKDLQQVSVVNAATEANPKAVK